MSEKRRLLETGISTKPDEDLGFTWSWDKQHWTDLTTHLIPSCSNDGQHHVSICRHYKRCISGSLCLTVAKWNTLTNNFANDHVRGPNDASVTKAIDHCVIGCGRMPGRKLVSICFLVNPLWQQRVTNVSTIPTRGRTNEISSATRFSNHLFFYAWTFLNVRTTPASELYGKKKEPLSHPCFQNVNSSV